MNGNGRESVRLHGRFARFGLRFLRRLRTCLAHLTRGAMHGLVTTQLVAKRERPIAPGTRVVQMQCLPTSKSGGGMPTGLVEDLLR